MWEIVTTQVPPIKGKDRVGVRCTVCGSTGSVPADSWERGFRCWCIEPRRSKAEEKSRAKTRTKTSPKGRAQGRDYGSITHQGKTQSLANWARELNVPYRSLRSRYLRGGFGD